MGEKLGAESRGGNLPVSSSMFTFLYTVGIPKARKELAIFDFAKLFILWQSKFGLG